jgi:hypothetical protein
MEALSEALPTHDEQIEQRIASLRRELTEARLAAKKWEGLAYAADVAMGDTMKDRDKLRSAFAKHREVVTLFLSELHATMIDPCATGEITVNEMQRVLLQAARDNRQALYDAQGQIAALKNELQTLADFAFGNGDVCEIIARRARAAIRKAEGEEGNG